MTCSSRRPQRNVRHTQTVPNEVEPQYVCIWSSLREVLGVYGVPNRDKRKPREGASHTRYDINKDR